MRLLVLLLGPLLELLLELLLLLLLPHAPNLLELPQRLELHLLTLGCLLAPGLNPSELLWCEFRASAML